MSTFILFTTFPGTNLFTFPPISSFMWLLEPDKSVHPNDWFSFNHHSTANSPPNTKESGCLGQLLIFTPCPPTSHKTLCSSLRPYHSPAPEDSKMTDPISLMNTIPWWWLFCFDQKQPLVLSEVSNLSLEILLYRHFAGEETKDLHSLTGKLKLA